MKKLAYFLLATVLYLGLIRALRDDGVAGVTAWLLSPGSYVLLAGPLILLRWHKWASKTLKRLLWSQRANLAGPVSILVGTNPDLAGPGKAGGGRRSRKWTILAAWMATLLVVASYLTMSAAALPTMALAAIAGLYWVCPTWRVYTLLAAMAVFVCAVPVLLDGDASGAIPMFYASGTLLIARTRRSLLVSVCAIAVMESFRHGFGAEALAVASGIALFIDRFSAAWDALARRLLVRGSARQPTAWGQPEGDAPAPANGSA